MKKTIEIDNEFQKFAKGHKTEIKKGGRAVIYQRVSSKKQEFGYSPEVQLDICYKWAEANEYTVVDCFDGENESGKSDENRKRFNKMLKFVLDKKNRIDAVIVYSTSRFSRTGINSFSIVDELKQRGITVFSASETYDARTPEGEWMQGVQLVTARHENAVKSRAVKDAGTKALRTGHWISKVPMGYDMVTVKKDQTISINSTGVLIRKAFKMKAEESITNEEVRKRMAVMGLDLSKQRWSQIFSNIFYAGYFAHPFLEGEVIRGPHEPIVSLDNFLKVNNIIKQAHSRGYEVKCDKEYAPLLGSLKCPVCGHNLTASLSTKMRKKYGREAGYYVCSRKNCKCNVPTKKANADFVEWITGVSLPDGLREVLKVQLEKAFPIINKDGKEEVKAIRTSLSNKNAEIEKIEYNLATATTPKIQEICERQLAKLEAEKEEILAVMKERDKEILNLNEYIEYGLGLKDNILKLWQLSNLSQKKNIQNLVFPDGLVWSKENDDIEPISKNEFLFAYPLKSSSYREKENGQTANFNDLSASAPLLGLEPRTP